MSLGNVCHGGTSCLTEKYVGPTLSLGIVAGERIPSERSPANFPQRLVAGERYPQRQVDGESPEFSPGKRANVVVTAGKCMRVKMVEIQEGRQMIEYH
ncbi:hypothetical protein Tco_0507917 [Tanacetum coccineum]